VNKKTWILGATVLSTLFASGCTPVDKAMKETDSYAQEKLSSVSVPFNWFKLDDSQKRKETAEWKEVVGLTLPKTDTSKKLFGTYEDVLGDLVKELSNKKSMASFAESNYTSREAFPYFDHLATKTDIFGETVRNVYSTPYQSIQSLTLTGIGERMTGIQKEKVITVTMNSVNDSEKFYTHDFTLGLDGAGRITNVSLNQEKNRLNTVKPLSNDSEWEPKVHSEFLFTWEDLRSFPQSSNWKKVSKDMINSWVAEAGIEGKEATNVFYDWYRSTEGDLSKGKVTGYLHTDDNALAQTLYEVTYPHKNSDKTTSFTVVFDRGVSKITGIRAGSPFEYKGE